jgi:hypothetical protein
MGRDIPPLIRRADRTILLGVVSPSNVKPAKKALKVIF